jgi:Ca2+:H+ antiporter
LMMLTLAAVLFPSVGSLVVCQGVHCGSAPNRVTILHVSVGISLVLLLAYAAYMAYAIFGLERIGAPPVNGRRARESEVVSKETTTSWPTWFSVLVLCLATAALVPITDILTGSVAGVTSVLHWSEVFVGIIVVANAGNVAEGYAALRLAFRRGGVDPDEDDSGLDLSMGIASASSIQIATFVAPVVVLYSLATTHAMNLVFSPVELAILGLLVIIFTYIAHDGESNWLEGVELLALYVMAAIVFYTLPGGAFGG